MIWSEIQNPAFGLYPCFFQFEERIRYVSNHYGHIQIQTYDPIKNFWFLSHAISNPDRKEFNGTSFNWKYVAGTESFYIQNDSVIYFYDISRSVWQEMIIHDDKSGSVNLNSNNISDC